MNTKIVTPDAPKAGGPYSQAIVSEALVFTSGQIPLTPEGALVSGTTEEQIHQIMKNLSVVLRQAGATFADVVKTTIYVTDMAVYKTVNEIYGGYMKDPYPARETVCIKELPLGANVEISMIAVLPGMCGEGCCGS